MVFSNLTPTNFLVATLAPLVFNLDFEKLKNHCQWDLTIWQENFFEFMRRAKVAFPNPAFYTQFKTVGLILAVFIPIILDIDLSSTFQVWRKCD
jgi:hypothetical protein